MVIQLNILWINMDGNIARVMEPHMSIDLEDTFNNQLLRYIEYWKLLYGEWDEKNIRRIIFRHKDKTLLTYDVVKQKYIKPLKIIDESSIIPDLFDIIPDLIDYGNT